MIAHEEAITIVFCQNRKDAGREGPVSISQFALFYAFAIVFYIDGMMSDRSRIDQDTNNTSR